MKTNCTCQEPLDIHNNVCGKCLLPLDTSNTWQERAKKAIDQSKENEHAWFKFKNDKFYSCAKCGIIERKDGKNNPCRGKVKITFRNS